MFDSDLSPELKASLIVEFEAGLVEKDDARWGGDGEFLKKSEGFYVYNMTEQLWYNFLEKKRSWPEDFEHENGEYMCRCAACTQTFVGYKRRSCCKLCANKIAEGNKPKFSDAKQVILVRKDLEISPGKLAAQVAHASVSCLLSLGSWDAGDQSSIYSSRFSIELEDGPNDDAIHNWMTKSFPKITLQVKNEEQLKKYYDLAVAAGLPASFITDAGRTEFGGVPTPTTVGIGPASREAIDAITGKLRVFS